MSQHLITEFINRTYVFKPFNDSKIVNHKVTKYQGSNRKNNIPPAMAAHNTGLHAQHTAPPKKTQAEPATQEGEGRYIDITV